MKLYATSISPALPTWANIISNESGLIEVEINDESPGFHSIIEELSAEFQSVTIGVKTNDLCKRIGIQMVDISEQN